MVKFCPKCGYKLVKEFKFCPECGFELDQIENDKVLKLNHRLMHLKENAIVEKKICDNCGEENDIDNIVCSGCGAKFTGAQTGKIKADLTKHRS